MNDTESKKLKVNQLVCWDGNPDDPGQVTRTNENFVTIRWRNGGIGDVDHKDMKRVFLMPEFSPTLK